MAENSSNQLCCSSSCHGHRSCYGVFICESLNSYVDVASYSMQFVLVTTWNTVLLSLCCACRNQGCALHYMHSPKPKPKPKFQFICCVALHSLKPSYAQLILLWISVHFALVQLPSDCCSNQISYLLSLNTTPPITTYVMQLLFKGSCSSPKFKRLFHA